QQFDVKTAFLYGKLDERIYMHQPEGFEEKDKELVCQLVKSLYGLKQAPRVWSKTFTQALIHFKFQPTQSDPSVYVGCSNSDVMYLCLYVDDGLVMSPSKQAILDFLGALKSHFDIKTSEASVFVGMHILREGEGGAIFLKQ